MCIGILAATLTARYPLMRLPVAHRSSFLTAVVVATLALATSALAADVSVDRSTKYQTIDGFGFFGAMDSWWGNPPLVSDAWATQVLGDLGATIWRNEYYPPADDPAVLPVPYEQDADWTKQKPVVQTLKRIADAQHVPLKIILTVWSPPSTMKCLANAASGHAPVEGTAPQSAKGGNSLCVNSRDAFAAWLLAGLKLYKDIGIDVYGLSFQNEPYFWESYNSCFYDQANYAQTLAYLGPKIKAAYPAVKLFGAENMLEMEAGASGNYFYTGEIQRVPAAGAALDIIAVHGYNDGVVPTASSAMSALWSTMNSQFSQPMNKPLWMTETSGYLDSWSGGLVTNPDGTATTYPGAADLAYSIYAALSYGHLAGWVWWQGSRTSGFDLESLMGGAGSLSKRYYVSKQFYRFIRPGARMLKVTSADSAVLAVAFEHTAMGSFTAVLINSSTQSKSINLTGAGVPASLTMYTTSATDNCATRGAVSSGSITLAPGTVNTLVSGNVYETGGGGSGGSSPPVPLPRFASWLLGGMLILAGALLVRRRVRLEKT